MSLHHSILSAKDLKIMLSKLHNLYRTDEILDLDIRYFYNLISLGSYYSANKIVVVLKFPIVSKLTFELYRLCPVPNKNHEVILPPYPYIATTSSEFVYMEAECPKIASIRVCEQHIGHQIRSDPDCISKLIKTQEVDETCLVTPISLTKEALTELDNQHYIVSFPKPTRVQLSCGQEKHHSYEGSFLATLPKFCKLITPEFTLANIEDKVNGISVEIVTLPMNHFHKTTLSYHLTSTNLSTLHNIIKEIRTETPVRLESSNTSQDILYHTTIPLYTIIVLGILSAGVLMIVIHIRKTKLKIYKTKTEDTELTEQSRRNATFALNIGK